MKRQIRTIRCGLVGLTDRELIQFKEVVTKRPLDKRTVEQLLLALRHDNFGVHAHGVKFEAQLERYQQEDRLFIGLVKEYPRCTRTGYDFFFEWHESHPQRCEITEDGVKVEGSWIPPKSKFEKPLTVYLYYSRHRFERETNSIGGGL